jgi:hypothetical protein
MTIIIIIIIITFWRSGLGVTFKSPVRFVIRVRDFKAIQFNTSGTTLFLSLMFHDRISVEITVTIITMQGDVIGNEDTEGNGALTAGGSRVAATVTHRGLHSLYQLYQQKTERCRFGCKTVVISCSFSPS